MKRVFFKWMTDHEGKMPTKSQLLKVVMGEVDLEKAAEVELALFVWDKVYPHMLDNATYGKNDIKHHQCPHAITLPITKMSAFSSMLRALTVLQIENARPKWKAIWDFQKKNANTPLPPKPTRANIASKAATEDNAKYYVCKWSQDNLGQVPYTSWKAEGIELLENMADEIDGFCSDNYAQVVETEKELLQKYRESLGYATNNTAPNGRKRKRERTKQIKKSAIKTKGFRGLDSDDE